MIEAAKGDGIFLTSFYENFEWSSSDQIKFKSALKSNDVKLFTKDMMYPVNTLSNIIKVIRDEKKLCF